MSPNLVRLLTGTAIVFVIGFSCYPLFFSSEQEEEEEVVKVVKPKPVKRDVVVDDWTTTEEEVVTEPEPEQTTVEETEEEKRRRALAAQNDDLYTEEDVPEDPKQKKVPETRVHAEFTSSLAQIKKLKGIMEREDKEPYVSDDLKPEVWDDPEAYYQKLAVQVMGQMKNLDEKHVLKFLEKPENRLNLARINLIRRTGTEELIRVAALPTGRAMLTQMCNDLRWICGFLYSGPSKALEQSLANMEAIYSKHKEDFKHPVLNKFGTIAACEFARERWSQEDMLARYKYYSTSYKDDLLNSIFDTLQYWEMRWVAGAHQPAQRVGNWGEPRNLAWMRDNVRLPAERYLGAEGQLCYRLRNVAGDSVFSSAYLAPILPYVKGTTAWAYREIGGVCGALSHYATYAAIACGLPAVTMGEPGHCAYAMRVNNVWQRGNSIYWQHSVGKTFFGESEWDFLIMTQNLYQDRYTTLVSDQLVAMADFLGARRKITASFNCYELAVKVQPLNWLGLNRYAGYLKVKAPKDYQKWMRLHDAIVEGLGKVHYNAASKLLVRKVYPNLVPMVKDHATLNKMFSGLFGNFQGWGTNRWNITPVLDAQVAHYDSPEEVKTYMREVLRVLMRKQEYAGSVLTWGLNYTSTKLAGNEKVQDEFSDMLVRTMSSHTGRSRKDADNTWQTLGEAINAATKNKDRRAFQAIGKLASRKCRNRFPKSLPRFRGFPGRVVSQTALIDTATTLDDGGVKNSCSHWGVLQRTGGFIPGKFEGKSGLTVSLEKTSELNGVVCVTSVDKLKDDRPFYLECSNDGQNWNKVPGEGVIEGSFIRFDLRKAKPQCKYVRMLREGDKYEPGIKGFYAYGKFCTR